MLRGLLLLPYRLAVQTLQQARLLTPLRAKLESIALPVGGLDESKAHGIVFALRQTATTPEVRRPPSAELHYGTEVSTFTTMGSISLCDLDSINGCVCRSRRWQMPGCWH